MKLLKLYKYTRRPELHYVIANVCELHIMAKRLRVATKQGKIIGLYFLNTRCRLEQWTRIEKGEWINNHGTH